MADLIPMVERIDPDPRDAELERLRRENLVLLDRVAELETDKMMLRAGMIAAVVLLIKCRYWVKNVDANGYAKVIDMTADAELWTRESAA